MGSVQYSALTRLLKHNNRAHDLVEILNHMPVVLGEEEEDRMGSESNDFNPFGELQEEIDREIRSRLVTCWLALPDSSDD